MLLARHPIAQLPPGLDLGLHKAVGRGDFVSLSFCNSRSVVAQGVGTYGPWAWAEAT